MFVYDQFGIEQKGLFVGHRSVPFIFALAWEYPFAGEFSKMWSAKLLLDKRHVARPGYASCSTPSNRVTISSEDYYILITIEDYSDLDTSSESEFESDQGSAAESDDEDQPNQHLEPEPSEFYDEYKSAL